MPNFGDDDNIFSGEDADFEQENTPANTVQI